MGRIAMLLAWIKGLWSSIPPTIKEAMIESILRFFKKIFEQYYDDFKKPNKDDDSGDSKDKGEKK